MDDDAFLNSFNRRRRAKKPNARAMPEGGLKK
jgi:hypothetical protein